MTGVDEETEKVTPDHASPIDIPTKGAMAASHPSPQKIGTSSEILFKPLSFTYPS